MKRSKLFDWPNAATNLARALPREGWHPAVLRWADDSTRVRWSVAFSGGADSLALLLLLWAHWPARRTRIQALHFNHRLRGRESKAEEIFCRQVCRSLGLKFITASWAGTRKGASEAEARSARQAFFAKHSRVLWLGHQQDDIAESMLMRLARGSGAGGLAAPRPLQAMPSRRVHLRPLLAMKKAGIIQALRAAKIPWREDSSNAGMDYFRNRVRHAVLPAWIAASGRDALAGAARSRELLDEDDAALEVWLSLLDPIGKTGALNLAKLEGKPRGLLRRALHRWLLTQPSAGELSRPAFDTLLNAIACGKPTRHSLGTKGFAVIRGGQLIFENIGNRRGKFQRPAN
jgi:tRNA(Ile)-lysidine synthase